MLTRNSLPTAAPAASYRWASIGQDAASSYGIYAQRYDSSGVAQGSEFRVNTQSIGDQFDATVATLSNGGFIIAWDSAGQDGGGSGVYAQRYDTAGMALGSEFRVNTRTVGDQFANAVASLKDGGFVVAWESVGQDAANSSGIYAQRYDSVGVALGSEFRVNSDDHETTKPPSARAATEGSV